MDPTLLARGRLGDLGLGTLLIHRYHSRVSERF